MQNRSLGRVALIMSCVLVILLVTGFACLLLFLPIAKEGIAGELQATDKADEFTCIVPAVLPKIPPTFGFISWRYTIRMSYDFGVASSGIHNTLEARPPPTSTIMVAIGASPGAKAINFESAEGVLEPYVMNICVRPLTRKWTFKFPQELPKRPGSKER